MAEIDGGGLHFTSTMDNRQIISATEETLRRIRGLSDGTVAGGKAMDAAFDSTADNIRKALGDIGNAIGMHEQELQRLEAEYKELGIAAGGAFSKEIGSSGYLTERQQEIRGEISLRKQLIKELQESSNKLEEHTSKTEKNRRKAEQNANTQESMRTRIRNVREEMMLLVDQGIDEQSEAYQKLTAELGRLQDIQGDVAQQGRMLANDEQQFQGIITGLSGLAGGFSAATGTMSLFGHENEDLQKVMTKVQSVMAITIGMQQVAQTLNKDSAFRLVTLARVKELYAAAINKVTIALGISTVAAKALMATLTLGLSLAITGIIVLIEKWRSSEKQKAEESKRLTEEEQKRVKELSDSYGAERAKIQALRAALDSDNVSRREKMRIIDQLKKAIPGYTAELNKEGNVIRENKKAIDKYMQSLEKSLRYKLKEAELSEILSKQMAIEERYGGTVGSIQKNGFRTVASPYQNNGEWKELERQRKNIISYIQQNGLIDLNSGDKGNDPFTAELSKSLKDYESAQLEAQKTLERELNSLERSRIEDKIKLIEYDRDKTIAAIEEEKQAYIDLAVAAGGKDANGKNKVSRESVDVGVFESRKKVANDTADNDIATENKNSLVQMQEDYARYAERIVEIENWKKDTINKINENKNLSEEEKGLRTSQVEGIYSLNMEEAQAELGEDAGEIAGTLNGIVQSTIQQGIDSLITQIPALQQRLDVLKKSGTDAKQISVIQAGLTAATRVLKEETAGLGDSSEAASDKMTNDYKKAKKALATIGDTCEIIKSDFGDLLGETGVTVVNSVQTITTSTIAMIGLITATAWTGAEAIKGVEKASVILAIIGAAIQIIMAIVNAIKAAIGAQDAELEKSIERKQKAINRLKAEYEDLSRAIDKALGSDAYALQKKQIDNLKQRQQLVKQQKADQEQLKKKDEDKIQEFVEDEKEAAQAIEDILSEMRESILGSDIKSIISDLGDAFFDAFAKGEDAAEAWGEKVDEIVGDIIKNMLIQKLLEKPIGNILDKYSKKWVSDDGTFKGEDAVLNSVDDMGRELDAAGKAFALAMENMPDEIKKYLIDEEEGADATSLSGAVKGVSEETASLVAGQMNAIRINQMEATAMLRQQLMQLTTIAQNTSYNRFLQSIDMRLERLSNSGNPLRSHGLL